MVPSVVIALSSIICVSLASVTAENARVEINDKYSCSKLSVKGSWETSSASNPILVVPEDYKTFSINVKYEGYEATLIENTNEKCFIIPQCKPLENVRVIGDSVSVFTFGGKTSSINDECSGFDLDNLNECKVVGPFMSYDASKFECVESKTEINKRDNDLNEAEEIEKLKNEVRRLETEVKEKDHVIEVFIEKAHSAQKQIAAIYFLLGVVFATTVFFFIKLRKVQKKKNMFMA